jgi:hypothetical protein
MSKKGHDDSVEDYGEDYGDDNQLYTSESKHSPLSSPVVMRGMGLDLSACVDKFECMSDGPQIQESNIMVPNISLTIFYVTTISLVIRLCLIYRMEVKESSL